MHSLSVKLKHSLFYIDERAVDLCLESLFAPREGRFITYLVDIGFTPKAKLDPYSLFAEHIPYTRRDFVLRKFYQLILGNTRQDDVDRLIAAFKRLGDKSPSTYLHKSDMGVLYTYHS